MLKKSSRHLRKMSFLFACALVSSTHLSWADEKAFVDPARAKALRPDLPFPTTKEEIIKALKPKAVSKGGKPKAAKALTPINFAFGSAEILPSSYQRLQEFAAALQSSELAGSTIQIAGHTDNIGSDEDNLELSGRRAESVKNYLIGQGVNPDSLVTIPYGESQPLVPNTSPEARFLNRRVEFVNQNPYANQEY